MELLFSMQLWADMVKSEIGYIFTAVFIISCVAGSILGEDFSESSIATFFICLVIMVAVMLFPLILWASMLFSVFSGIYIVTTYAKGKKW